MNKGYFIIIALCSVIYVTYAVKKGKFSVGESFFWILGAFGMLFLSIFPTIFDKIAKLVGISYPPSLFFVICIIFLLFINFRNSKRISEQQEKIIELGQQISIIKSIKNDK